MLRFNLTKCLIEKRINVREFARMFNISEKTIYSYRQKFKIKLALFALLESRFGDCTKYLLKILIWATQLSWFLTNFSDIDG